MTDSIHCERDGAATRITLNRPDDGNRVSNEMAAELAGMFEAAGRDGSKMIVLRGAGADFCLGRQPPPEAGQAMAIRELNTDPGLAFFASIPRCPIPIIAVVQGQAVGMGCAISSLADVTIAADDARFRVPEMGRSLPPTLVMWALADRVPPKAVSWLVYSREPIDAAHALALGLVSRVVPAAELDGAAEHLVSTLSENSAASVRAVKEYMRASPGLDRQASADFASNLLANVLASKD